MNSAFTTSKVITYTHGKIQPSYHAEFPITIKLEQTHTANFFEVTQPYSATLLNTDAALTRLPGVQLSVKHADCLPVLLYHPLPIIGAIHAGRKGTDLSIVEKVLENLKQEHGIAAGLQIWFGPAICAKCYQIDRVKNVHYDLVKENTVQVRRVFSASAATIRYSGLCTAHNNDHYFSYRKEGKGVPMNWSGITLAGSLSDRRL